MCVIKNELPVTLRQLFRVYVELGRGGGKGSRCRPPSQHRLHPAATETRKGYRHWASAQFNASQAADLAPSNL